jgi:hypothetical protein
MQFIAFSVAHLPSVYLNVYSSEAANFLPDRLKMRTCAILLLLHAFAVALASRIHEETPLVSSDFPCVAENLKVSKQSIFRS